MRIYHLFFWADDERLVAADSTGNYRYRLASGEGAIMKVTINVPRRVLYMNGAAHDMTGAGCNRVFVWLMDHARLLWGWAGQEYVFEVTA